MLHTCPESATQRKAVARLQAYVERLRAGEIRIETWEVVDTVLYEVVK